MGSTDETILHVGGYFGSYHVLKLLGKGGTGEVYLVEDETAHASYAVKVLDPVAAGTDAEFVSRFVREAEFALKVRHPNLVTVYDAGCDPETGLCYLVMEYLPDGTLRDVISLSPGGIPMADALAVAADLARALVFIETNGLVHRDVKPDNVLFAPNGTAKLTDFGIVRFEHPEEAAATGHMTHTKAIVGTPAYMAPEQMLDSHAVDCRSDIYSLGFVLYEMLAGRRPNEGQTAMSSLAKALDGQTFPDVRQFRPDVPAELASLVASMIRPEAARRPASTRMVLDVLTRLSRGPSPAPQPDAALQPWYRDRHILCAAAALALAVGALVMTLIHALGRGS